MSNFIHGDHSDISGTASNAASALEELVGQDLANYFPPPLVVACPDLVTESALELTYKNSHWSSLSRCTSLVHCTEYGAQQSELVHCDVPAEDEEFSQGAFGLGDEQYYCAGCGPDDSTVCLGV